MTYLPQNKLAKWRQKHEPSSCPILERATKDWVVDHDHKTGMVRGVISRVGNSLIGKIENFLGSRCRQNPKDFPRILRNIADYLERKQTQVLHPVGLTQLTKRFANHLTADEQYAVLRGLGGTDEEIEACTNVRHRKALFRQLTKNKHSNK